MGGAGRRFAPPFLCFFGGSVTPALSVEHRLAIVWRAHCTCAGLESRGVLERFELSQCEERSGGELPRAPREGGGVAFGAVGGGWRGGARLRVWGETALIGWWEGTTDCLGRRGWCEGTTSFDATIPEWRTRRNAPARMLSIMDTHARRTGPRGSGAPSSALSLPLLADDSAPPPPPSRSATGRDGVAIVLRPLSSTSSASFVLRHRTPKETAGETEHNSTRHVVSCRVVSCVVSCRTRAESWWTPPTVPLDRDRCARTRGAAARSACGERVGRTPKTFERPVSSATPSSVVRDTPSSVVCKVPSFVVRGANRSQYPHFCSYRSQYPHFCSFFVF